MSNEVVKVLANPLQGFKEPGGAATSAASRKPKIVAYLKAWAWRASASYIWLRFIALLFGVDDRVHHVSVAGSALLVDALARVGFSPTDPSYFTPVLKWAWVLTITGFSLVELGGFTIYVLAFPLGLILALAFGKLLKATAAPTGGTSATAKAPSAKRIPVLSIGIVGLLGWLLLYGDIASFRVIVPGVLFAGLLFVGLFYRFFRRVRPIGEEDAALLGRLEVWAFSLLAFAGRYTPTGKFDIGWYRWLFGWVKKAYRRLAILVRGRRGRNRVSIYVLLEYASSAVLLGVTAVIFWALITKGAVAPRPISMNDAMQIAASHFIPGLPANTSPARPPFWVSVGTGATAWVLFVIVIAPAGSVLPGRQAAHANRLARTYKVFRVTVRISGRFLRWLDKAESFVGPAKT